MSKNVLALLIVTSLLSSPVVCFAGKAVNTWEGNDMFTKNKVDDAEVPKLMDPVWWVGFFRNFLHNMMTNPFYWAVTFLIVAAPVFWKILIKIFAVINKDKFRV